jgi:serine/threonine protein kinase
MRMVKENSPVDNASPVKSRLVTELSGAASSGRDHFIPFLRHRLAFASSDDLDSDIERHYDDPGFGREPTDEHARQLLRAGLGVYLFCHHAERWGRSRDPDIQAAADALLADRHVLGLLFDIYEIDDQFRNERACLHETGTTSFILKLSAKGLAVKIIKPWYFDDAEISHQTASYKDTYGFLHDVIPGHFAQIYASNRRSIVMEFIDGITLREFFCTEQFEPIRDPALPASPFSLVSVLTRVCSILGQCASHATPTSHGDLTATNILIRSTSGELILIDFGANYLFSRPVGTAEQRGDVSYLHSERELRPGIDRDIYRLSILLAQGLLGNDFAGQGISSILDQVYERYPGIGYFLDDLYWQIFPGHARHQPAVRSYQAFSDRIETELADLAADLKTRRQRRLWIVDDLSRVISPINVTQLVSFIGNRLGLRLNRDASTGIEPIQLRNLTWVPVLFNWFAFVMFMITLARHRDTGVWPDIIGWACTLSYSMIAARYCVFVFSDLDLSDWPGRAKVSVPLTCVLIWPPILCPLLVDWRWWAICVAVGTAIIAVNNDICVRSCEAMNLTPESVPQKRDAWYWRYLDKVVRRKPRPHGSRLMTRAVEHLDDWWQLMGIFSGSMFVLSLLIWADLVHDGLFYGTIVAVAPAGKMYLQQIRKESPIVYAGLHRIAHAYRLSRASNVAVTDQEPEAAGSLTVTGVTGS